jgi:hypothetical protein
MSRTFTLSRDDGEHQRLLEDDTLHNPAERAWLAALASPNEAHPSVLHDLRPRH